MRSRLMWVNILIIFSMMVSSGSTFWQPQPKQNAVPTAAYRDGVVLVGIYNEALGSAQGKPGTQLQGATTDGLSGLQKELNLGAFSPLFAADVPAKKGVGAQGLDSSLPAAADHAQIFKLTLNAGQSVTGAIDALMQNPAVAFAEPDYQAVAASTTPDDPRFAEQWGLTKIQAQDAWDTTKGSADTVIAIIDSGIITSHEDLAGQLWVNTQEIPGNGIDDDHNGFVDDVNGANIFTKAGALSDSTGHGTQVAGVAAAASNNGKGVAGVCWNCKLMIVKVMGPTGTANYSDIAAGINYAVKMGAKVINLSLGGYSDSATLHAAVQAASQTAVLVAGAGNDHKSDPFYPAAYTDSVLSVAGTAPDDSKHSNSNYGAWVSVSAPGENILTTDFGGMYYAPGSGTSLAAPFVSGVAGLLISQHAGWSPSLVRQQITHTADSIAAANPANLAGMLGSGRINAYQAISVAPRPNFSVQETTAGGKLGGNIKADGNPVALSLALKNDWLSVPTAAATLSSSSTDVQISKASATFSASADGLTLNNAADTFQVSVTAGKYGIDLPFSLELTAGGATQTIGFVMQSESQEVRLSGSISTDAHWLASRTYHLTGNFTVKSTAKLTIDPGTLIQVDPGFFLKVEGALIADGTADAPIVFASAGNAHWTGLTFTDLAAPAAFDADGNSLSGSLLRHVQISGADVGVSVQTKAPYFFADVFKQNGIGIAMSGDSGARIENSLFTGNITGISTAGKVTITGNTFTANPSAVISGMALSGNTTITQNVFRDQTVGIAGMLITINGTVNFSGNTITNNLSSGAVVSGGGAFSIQNNRITGNSGGIGGSGATAFIQHNLVANNGNSAACTTTSCTPVVDLNIYNYGNMLSAPVVVYNPDQSQYLVAWKDDTTLKGNLVAADGSQKSVVMNLVSNIAYFAVAYNSLQKEYLVGYCLMGGGLLTQRLTAALAPIGSPAPLTTASNMMGLRLVYEPAENLYLAIGSSANSDLVAQYLSADGATSGSSLTLAANVYSYNGFSIAYDPARQRSLVTYAGMTGFVGVWVSSTGGASAPFLLTSDPFLNGHNPSLAYSPDFDRYAMIWASFGNSRALTYGQTFSAADGSAQPDSIVMLGFNASPYTIYSTPGVAYSGSAQRFFNVWSAQPGGTGTAGSVLGVMTGSDGNTIGSPVTLTSTQATLVQIDLASGGDQFLVAWVDSVPTPRIQAQRVNASDGALLGDVINVSNSGSIANNTIINNKGAGLRLSGSAASAITVEQNNLFGNQAYDLAMGGSTQGQIIKAINNYWGNVAAGEISNRIYDCNDDAATSCGASNAIMGEVTYDPPLAAPAQDAPGFVLSTGFDPNPVGINQTGTLTLHFSRPMDITRLPQVSFFNSKRGTTETVDGLTGGGLLAKDPSGNVWVGCNQWPDPSTPCWGIKRYDGTQWTTFDTTNGLGDGYINALYATRAGEVWASHNTGNNRLSRWSAGGWRTYTSNDLPGGPTAAYSFARAINEDGAGRIWFARDADILRFDGATWKQYTSAENPMLAIGPSSIARDGQGNMWFAHSGALSQNTGLSRFDGTTWTSYTAGHGLPAGTTYVNNLFGDSHGRVWFATSVQDQADPTNWQKNKVVGMIENGVFHYFGWGDSGYSLSNPPNGFAEDKDGKVWLVGSNMMTYSNVNIYDGSQFISQTMSVTNTLMFDSRNNLWMSGVSSIGTTSIIKVMWGGADYLFDLGTWLDATTYQTSYPFTARTPQGTYQVSASGAFGMDGVEALSDPTFTFKVDYAGQVSENNPPNAPSVTANGKNADSTALQAAWSVADVKTPIDTYRYAIGSSQGGTDILYWTTTSQPQVDRAGLNLVKGRTYWVSVQAHNTADLWGASGTASFVAGKVESAVFLPHVHK